ncbi:MAG: HigA family addiction module antidote protein [Legionellales bacterium]|nr:HigA family addiction module antidote protein [Legionellales bacterium]
MNHYILAKSLKNEFDAISMSVTEAAARLGVSRTALSRLFNGHSGISPEMALRLSKFFGTSIELWINLQAQYETWLISQQSDSIVVEPFNKAA